MFSQSDRQAQQKQKDKIWETEWCPAQEKSRNLQDYRLGISQEQTYSRLSVVHYSSALNVSYSLNFQLVLHNSVSIIVL